MSNISLRLKLAKMLLKFATVETDKGILNYEGELEVGTEVFIEDENGDMIPAPDGEYIYEQSRIIVKEGKIEAIEAIEQTAEQENLEEQTAENTASNDEAILAIAQEIDMLRSEIENIKNVISEIVASIEEIKKEATSGDVEETFNNENPTKKVWEL